MSIDITPVVMVCETSWITAVMQRSFSHHLRQRVQNKYIRNETYLFFFIVYIAFFVFLSIHWHADMSSISRREQKSSIMKLLEGKVERLLYEKKKIVQHLMITRVEKSISGHQDAVDAERKAKRVGGSVFDGGPSIDKGE